MQLSPNFHRSEFACRCAHLGVDVDDTWCHGESWPHRELVDKLQRLRDHFGVPVKINSGCRCPAYNAYIGGARMSQHKRGTAADIVLQGVKPAEVARVATDLGFFVLEYKTFTHVDVRQEI